MLPKYVKEAIRGIVATCVDMSEDEKLELLAALESPETKNASDDLRKRTNVYRYRDAASILNVGRGRIKQLVKEGRLVAVRQRAGGRAVGVTAESLRRIIDGNLEAEGGN